MKTIEEAVIEYSENADIDEETHIAEHSSIGNNLQPSIR